MLAGSVLGLTSLSGTAAAEPTEIDECASLSEEGEYVLTDDISTTGGCFHLDSNVTLDGNGHTVSGDGTGTGIDSGAAVGVRVRNLTVENFERGISAPGIGGELVLENVSVSNGSTGINGELKTKITLRNSTIRDNGTGISPGEASELTVVDSTVSGNDGNAVEPDIGHTVEMETSTVSDNGAGIDTGQGTFTDNTISDNDGFGVRLRGFEADRSLGDTSLVGNEISGNAGPGVVFASSSGVARGNTIANNRNGIVLSPAYEIADGTPSYEFTANDIEANDEFGIRNDADPVAVAICNYWGDPAGPDDEDNPRANPTGDRVSDGVEFTPWSVDPIDDGEATCVGGLAVDEFESPPTDPDGDDRFEDVNGDGEADAVDVQALFENLDDEAVRKNPEKFDFNGDGGVNVVDVQALFNEVLL